VGLIANGAEVSVVTTEARMILRRWKETEPGAPS
jgi:hypothetical protein